jgi:F0F1-type ATP synthase membrane subunit b/b'
MERVSEELAKIERESANIRSAASRKSEEMIAVAEEEAKKLISDLRKDAEEEAEELINKFVKEANEDREEELKKSEENTKELIMTSKKHINEAEKVIFDSVLGEVKI